MAILSTRYKMGFQIRFASGIALIVGISTIFDLFLVPHATGAYFLIITPALGMALWGLAFRWVTMIEGDNGVSGIPRPPRITRATIWTYPEAHPRRVMPKPAKNTPRGETRASISGRPGSRKPAE